MSSSSSQFDSKSYFEGIFAEYSDELFRFCITKVANREEAVDIVQETFFKLWQYIQAGTLPQNARALLYKMIRNKIIDTYRAQKYNESLDEDTATDIADETQNVALTFENAFDADQVLELLNQLPLPYKEVLTLRYVDDLSVAEIAQHLSVSANTVSIRIHRATKELQEIINKQQ